MNRDNRDYKPYTVKWIDDENNVENWLVDGTMWKSMIDMAEDKRNGRSLEIWTRNRDGAEDELLHSRLSSMKQKEMDSIMGDMVDSAKSMVEDYAKNPSEESGEVDVDKGLVRGSGIEVDLDEWKDKDEK
tara:strand:+ start:774 stop:1163 length:390 start_codon:yes stop_codon:yes gene_type:complete